MQGDNSNSSNNGGDSSNNTQSYGQQQPSFGNSNYGNNQFASGNQQQQQFGQAPQGMFNQQQQFNRPQFQQQQFGGMQQPQFGGNVGQPQQYQQPMMQQPPQPPQPGMVMGSAPPPGVFPFAAGGAGAAGAAAPDTDYFKGFYEGAQRPTSSGFGTLMSWVGPIAVNMVLFIGPLWWMRRRFNAQMAGGKAGGKDGAKKGMSSFMDMMNPMKPKQYRVEIKGTKFGDVIGVPEAKEDLKQYVDFLADPKKFTRLGGRLPKGCLLTGQPGTGKTLIAKAIAGEANRPFLTCSGADFIEIFGGSGPKRVRELFNEAKEAAPCVVFIDEIDAIGQRNSGRSMGGGSSEENRTINQLLAELDGLSSNEAVVVVAATNFPENIDKALTREGRFDRKVNVPMPDLEARQELFQFYLKKIVTGDKECRPKIMRMKERKKDDETDEQYQERVKAAEKEQEELDKKAEASEPPVILEGVSNKDISVDLSDRTPGVSPAQIATIVNEAALTCAVAGAKHVDRKSLNDAIDDVLIGKKHRQRMSDQSLKRTAYHECGHAMMAWGSPLQKDVIKISIIPRGRAGGYTQQVQDEAMDPQTNTFLFSQLCLLLGGRVAERIILGDISTGAVDDLQRATKVAMDQLLSFGMSKGIGHLAFKPADKTDGRAWMTFSEDLHAKVEAEARALVDEAYDHTVTTLTRDKAKLHELAQLLLKEKELMKPDIEKVLGARPARSDPLQPKANAVPPTDKAGASATAGASTVSAPA